jgi:hypothetical protein
LSTAREEPLADAIAEEAISADADEARGQDVLEESLREDGALGGVRAQSPAGDQAVKVWVEGQFLGPGVEYGKHAGTQVLELSLGPQRLVEAAAGGTVTVAAGVVGEVGVPAAIADGDVSAEAAGTAGQDVRHGLGACSRVVRSPAT